MSEDYDVGYGKPPKEHQYKKGESGNPNGRPPRKHLIDLLEQLLGESISVKNPATGQVTEVVRQDLILQSLLNKAAKGDGKAVENFIKLMKNVIDFPL